MLLSFHNRHIDIFLFLSPPYINAAFVPQQTNGQISLSVSAIYYCCFRSTTDKWTDFSFCLRHILMLLSFHNRQMDTFLFLSPPYIIVAFVPQQTTGQISLSVSAIYYCCFRSSTDIWTDFSFCLRHILLLLSFLNRQMNRFLFLSPPYINAAFVPQQTNGHISLSVSAIYYCCFRSTTDNWTDFYFCLCLAVFSIIAAFVPQQTNGQISLSVRLIVFSIITAFVPQQTNGQIFLSVSVLLPSASLLLSLLLSSVSPPRWPSG